MAAWIPQPVMFESSRTFDCEGFDANQCQYYTETWRNCRLDIRAANSSTFMCIIGIFIIGYVLTNALALSHRPEPLIWQRGVAVTRYLSYRGFHIKGLGWNSAPVGVLLLGFIGTVFFFCMDLVPSPYYWPGTDTFWGNSPPLGTRSGWLALACMPFVFATATKTNWITLVTGISYEKLQVFHRWIAYAFLVLALMHTFPFIVWHIRNGDMVLQFTVSNIFEYWTGIVALVFQAWLTFASYGPIRNLGYEFFKATHFLSAAIFMVIFFWHCSGTLTSWDYFVATAAVYVPCWTYPWLRTFFEYGIHQKAQIFIEENGFTRITIPANFEWQVGQHCFLRFRSFGIHALSSHPFTICSLPSTSLDKPSEITFYIRPEGGFTARLYKYAMSHPGMQVPVFVDGPYGGIDNQKYFSSDRLVVIAGGSAAGWMLPFAEQFLRYHSLTNVPKPLAEEVQEDNKTPDESSRQRYPRGPRSLRVILSTRDIATRTWFHAALNNMLSNYKSLGTPSDLSIEVHLTDEAEPAVQHPTQSAPDPENSSPSSIGEDSIDKPTGSRSKCDTSDEPKKGVRGRPDLPLIIREEAAAARTTGETMGVFVCGPLTMQNDARNAVARENLRILKSRSDAGIYLYLEHFSWA